MYTKVHAYFNLICLGSFLVKLLSDWSFNTRTEQQVIFRARANFQGLFVSNAHNLAQCFSTWPSKQSVLLSLAGSKRQKQKWNLCVCVWLPSFCWRSLRSLDVVVKEKCHALVVTSRYISGGSQFSLHCFVDFFSCILMSNFVTRYISSTITAVWACDIVRKQCEIHYRGRFMGSVVDFVTSHFSAPSCLSRWLCHM